MILDHDHAGSSPAPEAMTVSRERHAELERFRYQRNRERALSILGGWCVKCGATSDLQFDHVDPATKSFTISRALTRKPWQAVVQELAKCQLLCATCHKAKSDREETGLREHGTWAAIRRGKCKCPTCKDFFNAYRQQWRVGTGRTLKPRNLPL